MRIQRQLLTLALLAGLTLTTQTQAQWGDIKGKVIWGGKTVPQAKVIDVKNCPLPKDKQPLKAENLVVNPKNKGIKWAVVFLAKLGPTGKADTKQKIKIHPSLKAIKNKQVVVDQPCCMFEPRIATLREGQTLLAKNSAAVAHNVNVSGNSIQSPQQNVLIPPGQQYNFTGPWKARYRATPVGCNVHSWMGGYVWCFPHPYYAVTDEDGNFEIKNAPTGTYQLIVWHEESGWVFGNRGKGQKITIKSGENKVKDIEMKPAG